MWEVVNKVDTDKGEKKRKNTKSPPQENTVVKNAQPRKIKQRRLRAVPFENDLQGGGAGGGAGEGEGEDGVKNCILF